MKIKRYGTVGDMMEEYYQTRLTGYETRKTLEIERLERELVEFDAKARFLLALLEDSPWQLPVHPYDAGTWGPAAADSLVADDGLTWRRP
jgi:hypothetical protein